MIIHGCCCSFQNLNNIIVLTILEVVLLQVNRILLIWKIQQTGQNHAIWPYKACRVVEKIHPGNWVEVFIWEKFPAQLPRSQLEKTRSPEQLLQPMLSYEHIQIFTKDSAVWQDFGNRACPVNRTDMKRSQERRRSRNLVQGPIR